MDAWLRCVRFDFARHAAVGMTWKDEVTANGVDGSLCPASPTGTLLFESHLYRSLFEILIPTMVALTFSGKFITDALMGWKACISQRFTTSVAPIKDGRTSSKGGSTAEVQMSHTATSTSTSTSLDPPPTDVSGETAMEQHTRGLAEALRIQQQHSYRGAEVRPVEEAPIRVSDSLRVWKSEEGL